MKAVVEVRSDMSRRELRQALWLVEESAARLAHRMDEGDLDALAGAAARLARIAETERAQRGASRLCSTPRGHTPSLNLERKP